MNWAIRGGNSWFEMETKKTKYDTNPLDEDVQKRSEEDWGSGGGPPTGQVGRATQSVGESSRQNVYSEAPTRRYDQEKGDTGYPSVFIPPTYTPPTQFRPGQIYQAPAAGKPTSRSVAGFGLPEKWALMLPYAPFYVGLVVSLLELFFVPRKEAQVRFHASQALALHIGILIVDTAFRVINSITDSSLGGFLFGIASFVFLIVSMVRVWNGQPHRLAPLSEPAQWFNDRIEPRNKS